MVSLNSVNENNLNNTKKDSPKYDKDNVKKCKKVENNNKGCKLSNKKEKKCGKLSEESNVIKEENGKILFIEFSWMCFDLAVIGQILLSISFIFLGFLYFILGSTFSEVAGLGLLSFYLFLPTLPAYKSLANASTYSGILAFCFIQIGEVFQNMFILTTILYYNDTLEAMTIRRCYLVGVIIIYQLISIIIVTLCPFKKVNKETLKRLFGTSNEKDLTCITGSHHKVV
uniref:Transporter n=1 Tax=Strongyloides stercoralis TaxID=6248 RepID=A0A0K0EHL4_STRER